ncbi:hypothetical protein [Streptomyces sp. MK37H]|uniref:DUF7426 family protein n=1 Tax=Streptomyces sp. MK37H TaxID=2699117 RepID=UPI001B359D96|nr:hypothetical protein [Streptomyces sp. MK37H]MBP8532353.1 hypothetical protein [Streptomyces sp. MK37H]
MGARFEALDELFDDTLTLPIGDREYVIPSPSAEDGLRVQRITTLAARLQSGGEAVDTTLLDDEEEIDLFQLCLGPVYDELLAEVDWVQLRHAGLTAMFWIVSGVETAEKYWRSKGDPSLLAPNRETRRAQKKSGSGTASKTRSRGSTSGTSGRRATASGRKGGKT